MKTLLLLLLLAVFALAFAENVTINGLYGCDTVETQKLKLKFLRVVTNCAATQCKPGTAELGFSNYQYLQQNHCKRIPSGSYQVLGAAEIPGGRVIRVKSDGELLWVLD